jgi:phosphatidyl-myo-inositol dimannoside synthase
MRYVLWAHGEELTKHRHQSGARAVLARAEAIFANSEFTADVVGKMLGRVRPEVHVVPLGADAHYIATPPAAATGEGILTVARLSRRDRYKGVDVALQALALLAKQGCYPSYRIVGDGDDRAYLEQLAAQLGLDGQVRFLGAVPGERLIEFYDQCGIFLLCSREQASERGLGFEGFGIVYLEANARGKAVVGGRAGGVPSAVLDGITGLLVDPTSPASVAEALARLLGDANLRTRLGQQGRERTEMRYNWDQSAAEVRAIHSRICERLW